MKKNLTELVFIIDKSGSMSGLEGDTIGGFNSMLKSSVERTASPYLPPFSLTQRSACSMTAYRSTKFPK